MVDVVVFPIVDLTANVVVAGFPTGVLPPRVGVGAGDRILDAEAAVGFERSVVIFRLAFSAGGGAEALALDRARDAAVGAYNPEEGVLGRGSDEGVLERATDKGVLAREGVVVTEGLGVVDTRFAEALEAGPASVVDCPVY